jgi:hypothetical protein
MSLLVRSLALVVLRKSSIRSRAENLRQKVRSAQRRSHNFAGKHFDVLPTRNVGEQVFSWMLFSFRW